MRNAWMVLMEAVTRIRYRQCHRSNKIYSRRYRCHEFHLWGITTDQYSLSAHVVLDSRSSIDAFWL